MTTDEKAEAIARNAIIEQTGGNSQSLGFTFDLNQFLFFHAQDIKRIFHGHIAKLRIGAHLKPTIARICPYYLTN